jgi:DUF1680 family protein
VPPSTATTTAATMVPVAPTAGALQPLRLDEVAITGGFWADMQQRNGSSSIPHILHWLEKAGWLGNFDAAVDGRLPADRRGREFADSEIYKALEALAWQLALTPDQQLQQDFDAVVARVAAAQEPDGYLNTNYGRPGQAARYSDLEWGHELYCYGHLFQAAAARLRTGHDDTLVDVARSAADHVCATFGRDGLQSICGHPEIELGLVELGRALREPRYIEQASLFVDRRGHRTLADIEWGRSYFQDDVPVRDAHTLRGHAVRALYLASAAVDVAVENSDDELLAAVIRQWRHAVSHRTYITGGMGSQHQDEAFGADYALPPDRSYSETCAGVASVMLSWRLLLATGDESYADMAERTLFNVVAASPALDGRGFFYTNTLHQRTPGFVPDPKELVPRATSALRAPWFLVSCCPPNVARTLASLHGYLATKDDEGLQLHQYASCRISTELAGNRPVTIEVQTDFPRSGEIEIRSVGPAVGSWTLTLRVPSWADGAALTDATGTRTVVPGTVTVIMDNAASVRLTLPMQPRFTFPDPRIDAVRGTVAVERGPLVMCAESVDQHGHADVADIHVDTRRAPTDASDSDSDVLAPRPWASVLGSIEPPADQPWPYAAQPVRPTQVSAADLPLVPYFQWGNRGPGTMRA